MLAVLAVFGKVGFLQGFYEERQSFFWRSSWRTSGIHFFIIPEDRQVYTKKKKK
jgi:hypothetical protein